MIREINTNRALNATRQTYEIEVQISSDAEIVTVRYISFTDILSNMGGLASSVKIALVIGLATYTQKTYLSHLIKNIFNGDIREEH